MPIETGRKCQTIRAVGRRRHARGGEELQLYTGMRTRQCRLIGRATCVACEPIEITFNPGAVKVPSTGAWRGLPKLDWFAQEDGFDDWAGMVAFWLAHHGLEPFTGLWITWKDFRSAS